MNEEAAERARNFEYLLNYINKKHEQFEEKMKVLFELKVTELKAEMNNFKNKLEQSLMEL